MKIVPTYAERRQMEELILVHSTLDESTGVRDWDQGWNFERVAKAVNVTFKTQHARFIALALGWKIGSAPVPTLDERVAELERRLQIIEQRWGCVDDDEPED